MPQDVAEADVSSRRPDFASVQGPLRCSETPCFQRTIQYCLVWLKILVAGLLSSPSGSGSFATPVFRITCPQPLRITMDPSCFMSSSVSIFEYSSGFLPDVHSSEQVSSSFVVFCKKLTSLCRSSNSRKVSKMLEGVAAGYKCFLI